MKSCKFQGQNSPRFFNADLGGGGEWARARRGHILVKFSCKGEGQGVGARRGEGQGAMGEERGAKARGEGGGARVEGEGGREAREYLGQVKL